jgi:hypothetical protein
VPRPDVHCGIIQSESILATLEVPTHATAADEPSLNLHRSNRFFWAYDSQMEEHQIIIHT